MYFFPFFYGVAVETPLPSRLRCPKTSVAFKQMTSPVDLVAEPQWYITPLTLLFILFFFCTCFHSAIASNSPHLSFLCHYSTCFCLLLSKRYLYVCTVIPLAIMYPPPFLGRVINKAVTLFIYISVTQIPPLAHILTSYPLPPVLPPFPTLFQLPPSISVPLSSHVASFPWGWMAAWLTGYLISSPPPLPTPRFSTFSPAIQHTQMTQ